MGLCKKYNPKPQPWIDELDNKLSTMHLFNFEIQVYKDSIDSYWHLTCIELSWKHRSLPRNIDSLSLAKKEALIRVKKRFLYLSEKVDFILNGNL